jgi:DNA repair exonuclease SbcCD nuclease subunit
MSLSLLHFSDLHLDTSFSDSRLPPEIGRQCREKLRNTLIDILRLARERDADAVTIAGDFFENERVQPDTLKFIAEQFSQLAPTPVFIAPGLRDHTGPHSPYQTRRWPANVHVFLNGTLSDRSLSSDYELWGAARLHANDRDNAIAGFIAPASGKIPVLLLHAQSANSPVEISEQKPATGGQPLTLNGIANAGFGVALIGQQHLRFIDANRKCTVVCPGSPCALGFDDADGHGVAWVTLAPDREPVVEWEHLKRGQGSDLHFAALELPVDHEKSTASLVDTITQALRYQSLRNSVVRVRLIGAASFASAIDTKDLMERIEHHCAYLRIENHTTPAASQLKAVASLGKEPTLRGAFVREMLAQPGSGSSGQRLQQEALSYGLQSFEQENIVLR